MKILLTQFSAYHLWAQQQVLDSLLTLPQDLRAQPMTSSFGSLQATVLHLLDAESIWWQRMKLQEQIERPSDTFNGSFEELAAALMAQSKQWHEWIMAAQEHMFDHEFIYYNTKKEKFKQATYQVLLQIFNHGTYHRGQIVTLLRQLEVGNIPATDFILWSRKKYTGMSSK